MKKQKQLQIAHAREVEAQLKERERKRKEEERAIRRAGGNQAAEEQLRAVLGRFDQREIPVAGMSGTIKYG